MPTNKKKRKKSSSKLQSKSRKKERPAIVYQNSDEVFWEIIGVKDKRIVNGKTEFLVEWKGDYEDTWEPEDNLCDSAVIDAYNSTEDKSARILGLDDDDDNANVDERGNIADNTLEIEATKNQDELKELPDEVQDSNAHNDTVIRDDDDDHFDWSDAGQVVMQEIERISILDPDAGKKVTAARLAGTPVVLTGHIGWPQFISRWIKPINSKNKESNATHEKSTTRSSPDKKPTGNDSIVDSQKSSQTEIQQGEKPEILTEGTPIEKHRDPISESDAHQSTFSPSKKPTNGNNDGIDAHKSSQGENQQKGTPEIQREGTPVEEKHPDPIDSERETNLTNENPNGNDIIKPYKSTQTEIQHEGAAETQKEETPVGEHLDLSKEHEVDVQKMIDDVGDENVPILRKRYDETNPIKETLSIRRFLHNCWPTADKPAKAPTLYLHQWLFTSSETAVPKLCNQCNPLPLDILGQDLLQFWFNKDRCNGDNPFQYIFMGNTGTMSKLHKDGGGLLITIAPVVGEKEVILVHRADGPGALYHLNADIQKPDLHQFPMLYSARVWKSIIKPGEILIMPQGTYHQCRNVTPCLSYHRFHLDTVNLKAFFESYRDHDAPEIDHEEVIWNATYELNTCVSSFLDTFRRGMNKSKFVPESVLSAVSSLRILRHICREMSSRFARSMDKENANDWDNLVIDVEGSLHDFRHRLKSKLPPFRARKASYKRNTKGRSKGLQQGASKEPSNINAVGVSATASATDMFISAVSNFPKMDSDQLGRVIKDNIEILPGDTVSVQLYDRCISGTVKSIHENMWAGMIHYKNYSIFEDQFIPYEKLRVLAGGESYVELDLKNLQTGMDVLKMEGDEHFPATLNYWHQATFYKIELNLNDNISFIRFLPRHFLIEKVIKQNNDSNEFSPLKNNGHKTLLNESPENQSKVANFDLSLSDNKNKNNGHKTLLNESPENQSKVANIDISLSENQNMTTEN